MASRSADSRKQRVLLDLPFPHHRPPPAVVMPDYTPAAPTFFNTIGTSPTMCWSARRSAICRTSHRRPTSASVRNRRIFLVATPSNEGLLTGPAAATPPRRQEPLFMPRTGLSATARLRQDDSVGRILLPPAAGRARCGSPNFGTFNGLRSAALRRTLFRISVPHVKPRSGAHNRLIVFQELRRSDKTAPQTAQCGEIR